MKSAAYVTAAMDETEGIILEASTKKANIEAIRNWEVDGRRALHDACGERDLTRDCPRCGGTGVMRAGQAPGRGPRRQDPRREDRRQGSGTLQQAAPGRQVPRQFVVIGTLSSRMAGADGLNPQGIKHTKDVRRMFPLSWDGYILCGGDFDSLR